MNFFNKVSILCSLFILSICPYVSLQACGIINPCKAQIDDEGNIFMVWQENVNNHSVVHAKQKFVNGDWSASVKISDDEFSAHNPIVKTDGKGNAVALWMGFSENCSGSALFGCTIFFGENWSSPQLISRKNANIMCESYDVKITNGEKAVVIWNAEEQDENVNCFITMYVTEAELGKSWPTPVKVN